MTSLLFHIVEFFFKVTSDLKLKVTWDLKLRVTWDLKLKVTWDLKLKVTWDLKLKVFDSDITDSFLVTFMNLKQNV